MTIVQFIFWFWAHWFWALAFPLSFYIWSKYRRRLMRGKIHRYLFRKWGLFGPIKAQMWLLSLIIASVGFSFADHGNMGSVLAATYWSLDLAWSIIDYITGGDEPGKRLKKLSKALKKKFTLTPQQRPVLDF